MGVYSARRAGGRGLQFSRVCPLSIYTGILEVNRVIGRRSASAERSGFLGVLIEAPPSASGRLSLPIAPQCVLLRARPARRQECWCRLEYRFSPFSVICWSRRQYLILF